MYSESDKDDLTCDWENKYNAQCEFTNKIILKYNLLKLYERKLIARIKQLEENKEFNVHEFCKYKDEIEEKKCTIKKLKENLKSKEDELFNLVEQLNDTNRRLCTNIKFTDTELTGSKFHTEQTLKNPQLELTNKFNVVCEKLRETKIAFDEAKNIINNDIFNIKNTLTTITNLKEVEYNPQKMINKIQQLIKENGLKDEGIYCMDKKIKKLQRENECNVLKINKQKKQLQEWKLKIDNIKLLENSYNRFKEEHDCLGLQKKL